MIDLKHGDCLELMKDIPDGSVDMILADLPYGKHTTANKWDSQIDLKKLFDEFRRIITEAGCIALTGTFKFGVDLYNAAPDLYKYEWIWKKDNGTNFPHVNLQPFKIHEYVFIFGKGRITYGNRTPMKYNPQMTDGKPYTCKRKIFSDNWAVSETKKKSIYISHSDGKRYPVTIQNFKTERGLHHTQKPVTLLEYLIKTYTNPGETVLDPVMGSGSTGVACINTGRDFIGIEKDDHYFEVAKNRIEEVEGTLKASSF